MTSSPMMIYKSDDAKNKVFIVQFGPWPFDDVSAPFGTQKGRAREGRAACGQMTADKGKNKVGLSNTKRLEQYEKDDVSATKTPRKTRSKAMRVPRKENANSVLKRERKPD